MDVDTLFHFDGKSDAADAPIIFLLSGDEDGTKVWDAALRLAKGIAWILEGTRT